MTPAISAEVASALHSRHYSNIASALRARQYDARSVRGRRGIRSIRVAVPDTNVWAWWGTTATWWGTLWQLQESGCSRWGPPVIMLGT